MAPWRRRLASGLLTLAAISALGSAVGGIADLAAADPADKVLEAWRAYGLVVFAGLFALLALRPGPCGASGNWPSSTRPPSP